MTPPEQLLSWWSRLLERYCLVLAGPLVVVAILSVFYVWENLGIDADTIEMFSPDLEFRQEREQFYQKFPELEDVLLVVVEAEASEVGQQVARDLLVRLQADERIEHVYSYDADPYLSRHGLLFLEVGELEEQANRLAEAQPFLAELMRDPSLRGLFTRLNEVFEFREALETEAVDFFLHRVDEVIRKTLENEPALLSWQEILQGEENRGPSRQVLFVNPQMDFSRLLPAEPAIQAVREISDSLLNDIAFGAEIRLTGGVGMEYEEMKAARAGAIRAGVLAFVFVTLLLMIGFRSFRLLLASVFTLLCGLAITGALATFLVGTLNMISVAFAVLYIGLGVDYAIHLSLHYRGMLTEGEASRTAIRTTLHRIGAALALCAVSTAVGFYVFVLTDFRGVSELGLIAGSGVLVSLVVSLILLPAFLKLFPYKSPPQKLRGRGKWRDWMIGFPQRHSRAVGGSAIAVSVLALFAFPGVKFDYDPLNLRDQQSESVQTLRALIQEGAASPWTVEFLAATQDQVEETAAGLLRIEGTGQVLSVLDFVPDEQDQKLQLIATMDLLLGPMFQVPFNEVEAPEADDQLEAMSDFRRTLAGFEEGNQIYRHMEESLALFITRTRDASREERQRLVDELEVRLLATFSMAMSGLQDSLAADRVALATLPPDLRRRWQTRTGEFRIQVFPDPELQSPEELRDFAGRIQAIHPEATGDLIVTIAAGEVVVVSFREAFLYALASIILILLLYTRSLRDTLLILVPLIMAGLLTVAGVVLLGVPFNFANIIALPLLLGFGVDNGIHVVHRARLGAESGEWLLGTSTSRAVVFSSLTTIFSFGNLAFSPHPGSASMGLVLTLGVFFTLVATLIVLPAILSPAKR